MIIVGKNSLWIMKKSLPANNIHLKAHQINSTPHPKKSFTTPFKS